MNKPSESEEIEGPPGIPTAPRKTGAGRDGKKPAKNKWSKSQRRNQRRRERRAAEAEKEKEADEVR